MSIYAIYLNEPNDSVWKTVKETWSERHLILDDRLAFVAPDGMTTTRTIAEGVGIRRGDKREDGKEEMPILGVVLDVSAYSGFNRSDMWEWLKKAEEK